MAISEVFTLSAVTIGATEWSLTTNTAGPDVETSDGWIQVLVDFGTAMVAADDFELKIYEKVITGGTQRCVHSQHIAGVQNGPTVTPVLGLMNGWDVTLKKIAGTDRAVDASIRKAA